MLLAYTGQATAYKVGEIHIRNLRRQFEIELRRNFDLKEFHSAVLHCTGPLDILEGCVRQRLPIPASTITTTATTNMTTNTETTTTAPATTTQQATHGFWANATQPTTTAAITIMADTTTTAPPSSGITTAAAATTTMMTTTTTKGHGHTTSKNSASINLVNLEILAIFVVIAFCVIA